MQLKEPYLIFNYYRVVNKENRDPENLEEISKRRKVDNHVKYTLSLKTNFMLSRTMSKEVEHPMKRKSFVERLSTLKVRTQTTKSSS